MKQKQYYVDMQRYLNLNKTKKSETSTIQMAPSAEDKKEPVHLVNEYYLTQSSKNIYLKQRPLPETQTRRITWDKTGEVKLEGEHIPQSNISQRAL